MARLALVLLLAWLAVACTGATPPGGARRAVPAGKRVVPVAAVLPGLAPRRVIGRPGLGPNGVSAAALFSADDALLAIGEEGGRVRLFDARDGTARGALLGHQGEVSFLAAAPKGGFVSGDGGGDLTLWTPGKHGWLDATRQTLPSRHREAITSVSFSADGRTMVSADAAGSAFVWDMDAGQVKKQIDTLPDDITTAAMLRSMALARDGKKAAGWSGERAFLLVLADGKIERRLTVPGRIVDLRAGDDGFDVTFTAASGATRRLTWLASGKKTRATTIAPAGVQPFGAKLVVRRDAERFTLVRGDEEVAAIELDPADGGVSVMTSTSGKRGLLRSAGGIALVDAARGRVVAWKDGRTELGYPQAMLEVGRELIVADHGQVHAFDAATGAPRGRLPFSVGRLAAAADGARWGGTSGTAFVVDAASREVLFEARGDSLDVLSPDLSRIAARREGNQLVVAATEGGVVQASWALDDRYLSLVAFAPDGRSLLLADPLGHVQRIDVATREILADARVKHELTGVVAWDAQAIYAQGRRASGTSLLRIHPDTLAVEEEIVAGESLARTRDGSWLAWLGPKGVRVRQRDGASFTLPERLGRATNVAFDGAGKQLYVGRWGAVEVWALADLVASKSDERMAERKVQVPQAAGAPAADVYGDALPQHALQRFGTRRGALGREIEDIYPLASGRTWLIGNWGYAALWDRRTGTAARTLSGEGTAGARNTFVTPDEKYVVARGVSALHAWSVETGERVAQVERADAGDNASALSPKGDRLVIGTTSGALLFYSVPKLELVGTVADAHAGSIDQVAYSPDGKTLVSCGRGDVRFASGATGALERALLTPYEYGCRAIAFSPDGGTVYADMDGTHAYARGKDLGVFSGDEGNVSQLAVSPSGKLLAIGHHYHPVTIWDARKRTLVATVATPDSPSALAFSRDGKELLVGGPDGVLRAFETTGWTEVGALPTHSDLVDVAVADGGKVLATADRTGLVRSWDAATGALLGSRLFGDYPSLAAVDGGLVVHGDDLRAVDARTLADAGAAIPVSGAKLSSSRDGTRVALVDGHTLQLVDVKAGSVQAIEWGTQYADAIAMDPKGRFIAAGGMSGALRFYDGDGKERGGGRSGVVRAVAFSPSEPLVFVAARQDADLCLALEVPSGKERWRNDDASPGDVIAVSADGKLVAFGDHDGFHFLDAATGLEVALLPTDRAAYVRVLAFSADGKALYANDDRTVLAWDTSFIR